MEIPKHSWLVPSIYEAASKLVAKYLRIPRKWQFFTFSRPSPFPLKFPHLSHSVSSVSLFSLFPIFPLAFLSVSYFRFYFVDAIFMYLSKAFDTLNHGILMAKIKFMDSLLLLLDILAATWTKVYKEQVWIIVLATDEGPIPKLALSEGGSRGNVES